MQSHAGSAAVSLKSLWAGRIISAVCVLFLLFDGTIHVMKPAPVVEAFARLGWPLSLSLGLGILELVLVVIYVIPQTAILGAVLLTGYLGGATATNLRIGEPFWFPIGLGVLVWGGLFLRDHRVRTLMG